MKRTLALLVAVISAAALLSACSSTGEPPAATVGSTKISRTTLDDELRAVVANKALGKALAQSLGTDVTPSDGGVSTKLTTLWLNTLVNQAVADQVFARRHLTVTAKDRTAAKAATNALFVDAKTFNSLPRSLREAVLRRQARYEAVRATLPPQAPPTDAQLQGMLDQGKATLCPSGVAVAHILVKTKEEADAIEAQLAQGADFATLVKEKSTDSGSAPSGGLVSCTDSAQYNQLPASFRKGADPVTVGSWSPPVQTEFGFHVIKKEPWDLTTARGLLTRLYKQNQRDPMTLFINARLLKSKLWVDPRYGTVRRSDYVVITPPTGPNPKSNPKEPTSTSTPAGATGR